MARLVVGQDALATIDGERRQAIRRNHTATHLLHSALRSVLGDHVRQQGSLVSPEYLRFDFSHHEQPTAEELETVFRLANDAVLDDGTVETTETSREDAEKLGAIAFFGDKYGATVRVVKAGATLAGVLRWDPCRRPGTDRPHRSGVGELHRFEYPPHVRRDRQGGA